MKKKRPYCVGYVTAGGCRQQQWHDHRDLAEDAYDRFSSQGADVRLYAYKGDRFELVKEAVNG